MGKFSAASSALGYLFQAREGLLLLLNSEPKTVMYLERFDDIEFEKDGSPTELIQLKHKPRSATSLSDTSPDIWKTLRIWIEAHKSRHVNLDNTIFTIITTNKAEHNSVASVLGLDQSKRDVKYAVETLTTVAKTSVSKTNEVAYKVFLNLEYGEQYKLLDSTRIIDSASTIVNLQEAFYKKLRIAIDQNTSNPSSND
ncbi:MAG: hypothetical protein ACT4N5_01665 [Nitrosopumilaceae archaeon]